MARVLPRRYGTTLFWYTSISVLHGLISQTEIDFQSIMDKVASGVICTPSCDKMITDQIANIFY
uniref:Uncharacterized protein n=1 Tax=Nelumbo nucifera TaxID=4432 RepID=A0A822ZQM3_NELNU|nr:TPA_asm: hypothetical protein HUJ06_002338 [Nelumbo nucifera]